MGNKKAYDLRTALEEPESIRELRLINLSTASVPVKIFELEKLEVLEITKSELEKLPANIKCLKLLRRLNLSDNQICYLPEEINQLTHLQQLLLANNELSDASVLQACLPAQIEQLVLSNNGFRRLAPIVKKLKGVRQLNASHNRIATLPKIVSVCSELDHLNLSHNRITKIPIEIGNLRKLFHLELSNNRLKSLPDSWEGCQSLRQLLLNKNRLMILPASIGRLPWLAVLEISENELVEIADDFFVGRQIQQIDFSNNRLSCFPVSVARLSRLYRLYLSGNKLTDLPPLPDSLEILELAKNQFTKVPPIVSKLSKLKLLDLSYNPICELSSDLVALKKLEVLKLKGTELTKVPEVLFDMAALQRVEGLTKLSSSGKLLRFIRASRKIDLPLSARRPFFEVLYGKEIGLGDLSTKQLILGLSLPFDEMVFAARRTLFERYPLSNLKGRLTHLFIAGKSYFNITALRRRLRSLDIVLQKQPDLNTTHLLLGHRPRWNEYFARSELTFISEKDLSSFLNKVEAKRLALSPNLETLEKLRKLLLNADLNNVRIGVRLLHGGGVPFMLLTDLFYKWKMIEPSPVRRELRQLLEINLSENGKRALRQKISLSPKLEPKLLQQHIDRLTADNELNAARLRSLLIEAN